MSQKYASFRNLGLGEAMDNQTLPLLGKPLASIILSAVSTFPRCQLVLPLKIRQVLPQWETPVAFICRGKRWELTYKGNSSCKKLEVEGWRSFVVGNELKLGDACVFELVGKEPFEFRVHILSGKLPPDFFLGQGDSSDNPLLID